MVWIKDVDGDPDNTIKRNKIQREFNLTLIFSTVFESEYFDDKNKFINNFLLPLEFKMIFFLSETFDSKGHIFIVSDYLCKAITLIAGCKF